VKQYRIDELREEDYYKLLDYLRENADHSPMQEVYWINLPEELYSDIQKEHKECQPFYIAVNLSFKSISFEWLIRSRQKLHCKCIQYANKAQRDYIIDLADSIFEKLGIRS